MAYRALCMPSATARCAMGLHGMTLEKERHPGAERERSERAGLGRDPSHLTACAWMLMCATVPCRFARSRSLHGLSRAVYGSRAFGPRRATPSACTGWRWGWW